MLEMQLTQFTDSYLLFPAREHNIRWIQMLTDWLATVFTLNWTSMCEIHIYLESFWWLVPRAFHWYSSSHYSDISSKICITCFLVYYCIFLTWDSCREPGGCVDRVQCSTSCQSLCTSGSSTCCHILRSTAEDTYTTLQYNTQAAAQIRQVSVSQDTLWHPEV